MNVARNAALRGLVVVLVVAAAGCGEDAATPATTAAPAATTTSTDPSDEVDTTSRPSTAGPTAVVVDTDLAIDDLVALVFLLSSDAVDVRAITVSGTGEVRCPAGIGVVDELLARTAEGGIPVACGRTTPLAGAHEFPVEWRDAADVGWGVVAPAGAHRGDDASAADLLVEQIEPGVTLLALGPLTNVAEALRADHDLADRVDSIVIMGGAVDVAGNIADPTLDAARSEWNVYVDPTAAAEVLGSGAPVLMVPLDATEHVPVTPLFLERLALNSHTTAASLVAELYAANPLAASGGAYFWDPLAAAAIAEPGLVVTEAAEITVVTAEGPDSGRTMRSTDGFAVDVATSADTAALEDLLLRTLDRLSPGDALVEPSPPVAEAVVSYDGTECAYDGPTTVPAGRMGFTFESVDPTWVAAAAQLTGELTIEQILAWLEANPDSQEAPPGVAEVTVVPPGAVTYVGVQPPGAGVVCAPFDPGGILVATSIVVE